MINTLYISAQQANCDALFVVASSFGTPDENGVAKPTVGLPPRKLCNWKRDARPKQMKTFSTAHRSWDGSRDK
jgi:hypothetical protein